MPERVTPPPTVPEQRGGGASALARITTLQPRSYNEARTIGERYRDGVPVIMNLTELDDAAAKRLVDFAAGLAFALRGSIDKVTSRVFLLTPADVEVSADDARRLAERGMCRQGGRRARAGTAPLVVPTRPPTGLVVTAPVGDDGGVLAIQFVFYYALFFFWLLLLARIVAEMVRSFARQWVPVGPSAVALEVIFTVTDPPVKLLRRVIPIVRIGGVGLDLSIMVLLLVVFILMSVAQP